MADQLVPRADCERVNADMAATLAALSTRMAAMSTMLAEVAARFNQNGGEERGQREAPVRVSRGRRNCVAVAENSSLAEEDPEEEIELNKEDIIVAEEALEKIDELAMMRIMFDDSEEKGEEVEPKKEEIIGTEEALEEIDEVAMLRVLDLLDTTSRMESERTNLNIQSSRSPATSTLEQKTKNDSSIM